MVDVVEDIMALWRQLPEGHEEARAAFSRCYAERIVVNGAEVTLDDLVSRARALQAALSDVTHELLERVEVDDKLVIAFRLRGRHTGVLSTVIGQVPATGRDVSLQGMDVLTFSDGRITAITVVADELGLLSRLGAVTLQ
jgi:predicted ester cyclase